MPRLLGPILSFILRNVLSGVLWSLGSIVAESIHEKGLPMIRSPKLLFHPKVTFVAGLTALASFCTLIGSIALPLHKISFLAGHADDIVSLAAVVGPIALWVATYGRSPASAVDNNKP